MKYLASCLLCRDISRIYTVDDREGVDVADVFERIASQLELHTDALSGDRDESYLDTLLLRQLARDIREHRRRSEVLREMTREEQKMGLYE